ncbi:hypothetical protein GQ457_13G011300 [Hibiscus cannabinus]
MKLGFRQSPGGVFSVNPLEKDSDALSMLASTSRNKYAYVYLQEIVDEHLPDSNVEIIRDAEIFEHVDTVKNVETNIPSDVETVRNVETNIPSDAEAVRNTVRCTYFFDNEHEDTNYVGSESEQSNNPFEDIVGRDITGFRTSSTEDSDEGVESEAETKSLHGACDSETEAEKTKFPKFNNSVHIKKSFFIKKMLMTLQEFKLCARMGTHRWFEHPKCTPKIRLIVHDRLKYLEKFRVDPNYSVNYKSENQNIALKDALWKAIKAEYMKEWSDAMNELKMILESRDKSILTMIEMIICKIMTRFAVKNEAAEKLLEHFIQKFKKRILCIHASSVILHIGVRPEYFVSPCYIKETQLKIYSHMVKPIRGLKQWARCYINEPILPLVIRRPVDKPQTKRIKEHDELVKATGRMSLRGQVSGNARTGRMASRMTARPSRSNSASSSHHNKQPTSSTRKLKNIGTDNDC